MKKRTECSHVWRPFTPHKAKCAKCGKTYPWLELLVEYHHRAERAEYFQVRAVRTLEAIARWADRRPTLPPEE